MNKYVNVPCAKCGKPFTEEDDVVVCPDCGAPHHRQCYAELGHCALEAENHAQGKLWTDPSRSPEEIAHKACPRCGAINLADAQYCSTCGIPLDGSYQAPGAAPRTGTGYGGRTGGYDGREMQRPDEPVPIMTPIGPIRHDDDFDGVTAQEIAAYVGPNYRRYLSVFKMIHDSGRSFSFNWSGFFLNYSFLFYRKLYRYGIVVLGVMAMLLVPRMIYANEAMKYFLSTGYGISIPYDLGLIQNLGKLVDGVNFVQLLIMFLLASFSDKIYYKHVVGEIKKLRSVAPAQLSQEQWLTMLSMNGRVNSKLGYLSAGLTVAIVFGLSYLMTYNLISGLL